MPDSTSECRVELLALAVEAAMCVSANPDFASFMQVGPTASTQLHPRGTSQLPSQRLQTRSTWSLPTAQTAVLRHDVTFKSVKKHATNEHDGPPSCCAGSGGLVPLPGSCGTISFAHSRPGGCSGATLLGPGRMWEGR